MPFAARYVFRQCTRPSCQFRFPVESANRRAENCPKCGGETRVVAQVEPQPLRSDTAPARVDLRLEGLLDNVRSIFNVGAIFRSAEGAGFASLHLCGITPTPEHPKLAKTALGAETCLPWTHAPNALAAAQHLKEQGAVLWALECTREAQPLYTLLSDRPAGRLVLIVGNEVAGVDPGLIALCDRVAWLPMQGHKESLNVAVAFGIAAYAFRYS